MNERDIREDDINAEEIDDRKLSEKQKARLKYLADRAGISYKEAISKKMSQRQLKKLASSLRYEETLKSKRKEEKEKRKKFRQAQREAGQLVPKIRKKRRLMAESNNKVNVAIDLSFDGLMTEKDQKKLRKQLMRCYSCNRSSENPLQLHLTSVGTDLTTHLNAMNFGFHNWDIHVSEKSYLEVFQSFKASNGIVYLTRDSENVLPSPEIIRESAANKVYVIGGLVDHNTHKGLTLDRAKQLGIDHARLPIDEHMKMLRSQVLTVNHCFEIMLLVSQGSSWKEALDKIIPDRKRQPQFRHEQSKHSRTSESDSLTTEDEIDQKTMDTDTQPTTHN